MNDLFEAPESITALRLVRTLYSVHQIGFSFRVTAPMAPFLGGPKATVTGGFITGDMYEHNNYLHVQYVVTN